MIIKHTRYLWNSLTRQRYRVWVILLMHEQNDVYYMFYKIMFYLFYKMMFYNLILIMTGHYHLIMTGYPKYTLGKINAWSRLRFQPII